MENIIFSIGHDAKKRRAKNYDITWSEFVTEMVADGEDNIFHAGSLK